VFVDAIQVSAWSEAMFSLFRKGRDSGGQAEGGQAEGVKAEWR
jgi:hypothetical protein